MLRACVIQKNSGDDKPANLRQLEALLEEAVVRDRPDWILLPEHFEWLGGAARAPEMAEPVLGGEAYNMLQALARRHRVWIHGGSFYERADVPGKAHNTSVVFDRVGREAARYRKIHLFDVTTMDGARYHESATILPGDAIVTYDCEGVTIGCAICYDLRFPELFAALVQRSAQVIALPAAFTLLTGKDHWEPLLRARAIETQCWLAAAGQWGSYATPAGERQSFGQSMILDPWGHIVARASDGTGHASADLDMTHLDRTRAQIPVRDHRVIGTRIVA